MSEKLIITKKDDKILSSTFDEKDLIQIIAEKSGRDTLLGNIYLGKVKNIVKNIDAAFVEIENGLICYMPINNKESPLFTSPKKNNKIVVGDTLVVQVVKEDVKTKAPCVTANFSFTGKYIVLTHGIVKQGISAKITAPEERERLKNILSKYKDDSYGLIARTNSEGVNEERIESEIKLLKGLYQNIMDFGVHKTRFSCIYYAPSGFLCNIRDGFSEQLGEIITDDAAIFKEVEEYLNCYQPEDLEKLRLFQDETTKLNNLYGIETKLLKALQKQVWLKSGGSLVIEVTEALTVIDVNTGKAIKGKKKVQETFRKVNIEAAYEIARQIRLRNLSGIIIVDFIDMEEKEDNAFLLQLLHKLLLKDPVKTVLVDMTALGLVEITRKKVRKPLHEQFKNSII